MGGSGREGPQDGTANCFRRGGRAKSNIREGMMPRVKTVFFQGRKKGDRGAKVEEREVFIERRKAGFSLGKKNVGS